MSSSSSSISSSWITLLLATASAVVLGAAAMALDRKLFKRRRSSKKKSPPLKFEDGSKESMIQARFQACVQVMGPQIKQLPQRYQLQYYGLFKQATLGDCDEYMTTPPPKYDVVASAKYQAWKSHKGTSPTAAMQGYIDKVVQFEYVKSMGGSGKEDHDYGDDELEGEAVVDVVGMGNNVSTLMSDEGGDGGDDQQFPLHAAAREGRVEELDKLLASNADTSNLLDPSGQTPLHLAADRGHVDCVKKLVLSGSNVHAVDHDGISILQAAVIGGDAECCKLLLALGCDPHQADQDGDTPAHSAKDDKKLDIIFMQHENSPLQLKDVEAEFVKQMEKAGIDINQQAVDAQAEMKKLDQTMSFDFDDDGDM